MMGIMFGNGMNSIIIGTMMNCCIFHKVGEIEFARLDQKLSTNAYADYNINNSKFAYC